MLRQKKIAIRLRPEARKWIVDKTCADRSYGARPLRRAIQKYIEDPLSEALIRNQFRMDTLLEIYLDGDTLYYLPDGEAVEGGVRLST